MKNPSKNWTARDKQLAAILQRIRICIFFDSESANSRALNLLQRVWHHFPPTFALDIRLWRAGELEQSATWDPVLSDLRQCEMLIVAADADNTLLAAMRRWTGNAAPAEGFPKAMIALIDPPAGSQLAETWAFLRRFASEFGFDFISDLNGTSAVSLEE